MAMVSSRLVFLFSICILISQAFAQKDILYNNCSDNGNYTSNSTYKANLNHLLSFLSSNTKIDYGFYNFSYGKSPDQVYSLGLCRGDVNPDICASCLNEVKNLLTLLCPNQKEAIIWYDYCMLRYSFRNIFGIVADSPTFSGANDNNVAANYDQFRQNLKTLLNSQIGQAAAGGSLLKFAVGNTTAPNLQTLYSLVQCTPDLSEQNCSDCLVGAMGGIPQCCEGRQGGRVVRPSCNLRFEVFSFYNATAYNASSPSLSPPPPPVPSVSPPASNNTPAAKGKESNKSRTIIIVGPIISFVVLIIISFCIYLRVRKPREKPQSESVDEIRSVESLQLGFGTIKVATDDFSDANKLGQGGFGVVYKGKLSDGQVIAVKRLSKNSGQGDLEFKNEVLLVAKLQHRNLVRLLGFCLEGIEKLLIYEFMPNGSLDNFIFDPIKCVQLDWARRYNIIGGIARGLLYLHEDSRLRIIHRDLKASNILLDSEMNSKISDFGMARLFELNQSEGSTSRIVGTYGYMPPEYAMHGQFSVKSDVFSFGVLVLEIISGRKNNSFQNGENIESLLSYAWKNWKQGIVSNLVDPTLKAGSTTEIMRCIHIGLLCVQENVAHRPTMTSVVLMLNSYSISLPIPSEPAFLLNSGTESNICLQWEHDSRVTKSNQSKSSSVQASINEVSITELYPR
ncbi:putative receptor-like protein kinase At4g00960 isoform X2 [Quercus lobata]|uniref:putative receptor-like protein kinase At4g00960 isoform X2 n=1 Tax=Quercus lobata TaxID=97700 RepID=UPI001244E865|nr:putative receptor-like protein kinase At4g00960 isoform X2 [Quercus lobata]